MTTRVAHPRYDSYHMNEMINYFKVSPIIYSSDRDIHATICTLFGFLFTHVFGFILLCNSCTCLKPIVYSLTPKKIAFCL